MRTLSLPMLMMPHILLIGVATSPTVFAEPDATVGTSWLFATGR